MRPCREAISDASGLGDGARAAPAWDGEGEGLAAWLTGEAVGLGVEEGAGLGVALTAAAAGLLASAATRARAAAARLMP